jgi:Carboxypeptidase regulatory-like domain/TonB dependent receptor-like, beta-barrel
MRQTSEAPPQSPETNRTVSGYGTLVGVSFCPASGGARRLEHRSKNLTYVRGISVFKTSRACLWFTTWLLVSGPIGLLTAAEQSGGVVRGTVFAREDDSRLPGVVITIERPGGTRRYEATTDDRGQFEMRDIAPGEYALRTTLTGFGQPKVDPVMVSSSRLVDLTLRLPLANLETAVTVEAPPVSPVNEVNASTTVAPEITEVAPLAGDSFQAVLPVIPGVIRRDDGRISLNGGRPEQSGLQVNAASVTDPVTGGFGIDLPIDAVESIEVISGAYAAEYGRFSAGVARVETRRGSDEWKYAITNFVPIPRFRNGTIEGISRFGPRAVVGGPLVRNRLFITESAQYEMRKTKVPSLPDGENDRRLDRFTSYTRLDAIPADQHLLTGAVAIFPRRLRYVNLNTFNQEPVSPDLKEEGYQVGLTEHAAFGSALLESEVTLRKYDVQVDPRGQLPMRLELAENAGNYFHADDRHSHSVQWLESFSWTWSGRSGEHHVKVGSDLLRSSFSGATDDRPLRIVRADGSLSQVFRPFEARTQDEGSTDLSLYAQDQWRMNNRLLVQGGFRFDRDGVLEKLNIAPRVGATMTVDESGATVLRGGYGVFFQRTSLNVAAFESYPARSVERFARNGTLIAAADIVPNVSAITDTPHAFVASIEVNRRIGKAWLGKVGYLHRRGEDEYVVNPIASPAPALLLTSTGKSKYAEIEGTIGYHGRDGLEMFVSYVRSRSRSNYNDFGRFFGNIREPVIRGDEYARSSIDVPNRVLVRGTVPMFRKWQIAPLFEIRNGFPYSSLDEEQQFVGVRNDHRFPTLVSLDLAVNREIRIKKYRLRVGIRTYHLVGTMSPRDVDNNVNSPNYGTFYNGLEHKFGMTFQILP